MKILFLDIDGVLNYRLFYKRYNASYKEPPELHCICYKAMKKLNLIVEKTGCLVVVSSTWRKDDDCKQLLIDRGFKGAFHDRWRTPRFIWNRLDSLDNLRGQEIKFWLDLNSYSRYVIVDDSSDLLPEQLPFFVHVNYEYGLTRKTTQQAINILNSN